MAKFISEQYRIIKLDKKDKEILYELDKNSRITSSRIAKKLKLSKDIVQYRIKKMQQLGVIHKFLTILDTAKLGYTTYKFLIKLQNISPRKEKQMIKYLVNHKHTQYVVTTQGIYDIIINVLASSPDELTNVLNEINQHYGKYIAQKDMLIMVKTFFFYRDYLVDKSSHELRKNVFFGSKPGSIELDEINRKMVRLLGKNARISLIDMAKQVELSSDTVLKRLKKLEQNQIIQNYVMIPNTEKIGYLFYKVLLKFNNNESSEQTFFQFCKEHKHIWWWSKSIGIADAEINIDVESEEEFKKILNDIKMRFHTVIRELTPIKITQTYKFNLYPMDK